MPFVEELQELESLPSGYPFVSLYLDVGHDEQSAEKMRVFTRNGLRQALSQAGCARERHRLEADARHITAYLEDVIHARVNRKSQGLGIFACSGQKVFQVVSSPEPFASQLHVGDRPHLQPLRDRALARKRILTVHLGPTEQRIVELGVGPHPEHKGTPREIAKHASGGWSHMRFRRIGRPNDTMAVAELAEALQRLSDEAVGVAILMQGDEGAQERLRMSLPARTVSRVLQSLPHSLSAAEARTLNEVLENTRHMAPHDLDAQMEPELEAAMSPHRGARGIDEVLRATNAHSVRSVFLSEDFAERGWRCTSCGALGAFVHLRCNYCGGNIESTDLRPELEARILTGDGTVNVFPRARALTHPVLASLRYV
jgi:peptide subunit release factor 1 (eRF1)